MDNRVFYQHPDLMRSLCVHETVMAIMVNRLNKSKQEQTSMSAANDMDGLTQTNDPGENQELHPAKVSVTRSYCRSDSHSPCSPRTIKWNWSPPVVNSCRTSAEPLGTINERCSSIWVTCWKTVPCYSVSPRMKADKNHCCCYLARPSLRGSAPLDVACASVMDNNELALALRESHLEKIASYLSRCGTTRNEELFLQGYHDIGWDPVDGERCVDIRHLLA